MSGGIHHHGDHGDERNGLLLMSRPRATSYERRTRARATGAGVDEVASPRSVEEDEMEAMMEAAAEEEEPVAFRDEAEEGEGEQEGDGEAVHHGLDTEVGMDLRRRARAGKVAGRETKGTSKVYAGVVKRWHGWCRAKPGDEYWGMAMPQNKQIFSGAIIPETVYVFLVFGRWARRAAPSSMAPTARTRVSAERPLAWPSRRSATSTRRRSSTQSTWTP